MPTAAASSTISIEGGRRQRHDEPHRRIADLPGHQRHRTASRGAKGKPAQGVAGGTFERGEEEHVDSGNRLAGGIMDRAMNQMGRVSLGRELCGQREQQDRDEVP